MEKTGHVKKYILVYITLVLGAGSLLPFYAFLFFGPFNLVDLRLLKGHALALDAALCLLFFLQHSIVVRKVTRRRLQNIIPADYYGAFYSITSSIPLILMIVLWQKTAVISSAEGVVYWVIRLLFILGMIGFYWGIKSLGLFDPFGTMNLRRLINNKPLKTLPLSVKGPYRWVRHPLYFFSLIMIWANPHFSYDRLLFNVMWTAWIIIGTMLEERDLVADFGDGYRDYQKQVPMLIPYKQPMKQVCNEQLKMTTSFSRFVPKEFLSLLKKESIVNIELGDQVLQEMPVLFTDIRSYTTLSEKMTPQENINFLNLHLSKIVPIIKKHNGFIDKYIGDAIMALFPGGVDDAVSSAVEMQKIMNEINIIQNATDTGPVKIGIGIHIGKLMLGTIGQEDRLDTTVISDAVNIASRLESMNKHFNSGILISDDVYKKLADPDRFNIRKIGLVRIRGKENPVRIREVCVS